MSHHPVEACEVNPSRPCVQPYPAFPMEQVDTSPVAHQPPPNSFLTTPLAVNSTHSMQSCPYAFSAPLSLSLDCDTLLRYAPILNPISNWESKLVINLSLAPIDPLAFNFLKRDLNFALTPRNIPHIDFLIKIENVVRTLPLDVAEERPDVKQTLATQLYDSFEQLGVRAFLDSEEKELGNSFPSTILTAIRSAKPSDLRHIERGAYAEAFLKYEEKGRYTEKLNSWMEALQSLSFIAGEEFKR
ncbi:hypothetical protein SUGI_0677840 [Cryptomeria japonica]|nr:hypothetical protein SUGI_0677840 [Cryptomeria japonica]